MSGSNTQETTEREVIRIGGGFDKKAEETQAEIARRAAWDGLQSIGSSAFEKRKPKPIRSVGPTR